MHTNKVVRTLVIDRVPNRALAFSLFMLSIFLIATTALAADSDNQIGSGIQSEIDSEADGDKSAESTKLPPILGSLSLHATVVPSCEHNIDGMNRIGSCCSQPVAILNRMKSENLKGESAPFESVFHCEDPSGQDERTFYCSVRRRDMNCKDMTMPQAKSLVARARVETSRLPIQTGKIAIDGPDIYPADLDENVKWQIENRHALIYFASVLGLNRIQVGQNLQVDRELGLTLPMRKKSYGPLDAKGPKDASSCPEGLGECEYPVYDCILPALQLVYVLESTFRDAKIPGAEEVLFGVESCSDAGRLQSLAVKLLEYAGGVRRIDSLKRFVELYQVRYFGIRESLDMSKGRNDFEIFGWDPQEESAYAIELGKPSTVLINTEVIGTLIFGSTEADSSYEPEGLDQFLEKGLNIQPVTSGDQIKRD